MYKKDCVEKMMICIANKAKENVDILAELDGLSGDGDLGETIGKSASAIIDIVNSNTEKNIGDLFMKTAIAMNKVAPSTLGTLLSSAVLALAKENKGKTELSANDVANIPHVMAVAIQQKGKANVGDKTILDALIPMSEAVIAEFKDSNDLKLSYKKGASAAKAGAESTSGMIPKAGRAQWIGERVKDNLDGGAVLCAIVAELFL